MIGRAPMMFPQQYVGQPMQTYPAQTYPHQSYPGPQSAQMQVPQPWPPVHVQPAQQPKPAPAVAQQSKPRTAPPLGPQAVQPYQAKPAPLLAQQTTQPFLARGKYNDEAPQPVTKVTASNNLKLAPLALPAPEELGVVPTARATPPVAMKVDWNTAHERVQRLGGTTFQVARTSDGCCRVAFVLQTNQADKVHHVEAVAATEAEAVAVALAQAEQWATGSRP